MCWHLSFFLTKNEVKFIVDLAVGMWFFFECVIWNNFLNAIKLCDIDELTHFVTLIVSNGLKLLLRAANIQWNLSLEIIYIVSFVRSCMLPKSVIKPKKSTKFFTLSLYWYLLLWLCIQLNLKHFHVFHFPCWIVEMLKLKCRISLNKDLVRLLRSTQIIYHSNFYHYHQFECHRLSMPFICLKIVAKLSLCFGFEWN